jgi:hypothetical protein
MRTVNHLLGRPLRTPARAFLLLFLLLSLWPSPVLPEVVEDWSGVVPWFRFTFKKANHTGRFMDNSGSRINFGTGKTTKGKKAIKLTFDIEKGGYGGAWNQLDRTVDIRPYDYLSFEIKAAVPGPVRLAIKDDRNVTYVTSFLAPSSDWVEVDLPISVFVKDRFATPDSQRSKFMGNEKFDEAVFRDMDPYQQAVKEGAKNRNKKRLSAKKLLEAKLYAGIQDLDTRSLAAAEVLCGPGQEKWGPETRIDWGRIRTFCVSPLITGKGEVVMGPIEALKWKKKAAAATPTPTPAAESTPTPSDVMNLLEMPANFYVKFTGPAVYQLELLDANGVHYRTLFRQRITAQEEAWVQWDGLSEQGTAAPPGIYQLESTKDGLFVKRIKLQLQTREP